MESHKRHNAHNRLDLQATRGPASPATALHLRMENGRATCFSCGGAHGRARTATTLQGQHSRQAQRGLRPPLGTSDGGAVQGRRNQGQVPGLLLLAGERDPGLLRSGVPVVFLSTLPVADSAPCRPRQRPDSNQTPAKRPGHGLKTEVSLFFVLFEATDGDQRQDAQTQGSGARRRTPNVAGMRQAPRLAPTR